jgi:hypothetical protein
MLGFTNGVDWARASKREFVNDLEKSTGYPWFRLGVAFFS